MTDAAAAVPRALPGPSRGREQAIRVGVGIFFGGIFLGNIAAIVWLWVANHNLDFSFAPNLWAAWMTRLGGLTGLLAAYLALVQVLLLARLPLISRLAGFDRLTIWHRWNGYACLILVLAHTVMAVVGYSIGNRPVLREIWALLDHDILTGMVTATVGLGFFVLVTSTSIVIVRRRLPYELWYAVHITAYAGIALAWFHEIPTGGDINTTFHQNAATYWRVLFFGTFGLLVFRVLSPFVNAARFGLRVAEVTVEGPTVTSLRITGRNLDRLPARAGQFLIWRFLTRGFWWTAHPFSLSAAPDGRSLRISVKASGDHTNRIGTIPVGTRVLAEGPFGTFTDAVRRRPKVLLIAGGIGITPVRALAETMTANVALVYRVLSDADVVFADELAALVARRGIEVHYVVGDHASAEGRELLSTSHLRALIPDIADRDVYVCGPPAMVESIRGNVRAAGVPRRRLHVERFAL